MIKDQHSFMLGTSVASAYMIMQLAGAAKQSGLASLWSAEMKTALGAYAKAMDKWCATTIGEHYIEVAKRQAERN